MNFFSRRFVGTAAANPDISRHAFSATATVPDPPPCAAVATIARLLDQLVFGDPGGNGTEGPLRLALGGSDNPDLTQALASLSDAQRTLLQNKVPATSLQELISLSGETDSPFFAAGLLEWARREETADRFDAAGLVYGLFEQRGAHGEAYLAGADEAMRRRAAESLDAMLGRGSFRGRLEFLSRRFIHEATDPIMLLGMGVGSAVFTTARTAFLSRLLSAPVRHWATAGFKARALASAGAFLFEVPAVWGSTKGLHEALNPGHQAWDFNTNLRELAGLGLTLGALKISGAVASKFSRHLAGASKAAELAPLQRFGHAALGQGLTLGGIYLGRFLEETAGLRRHVENATPLLDSLSMLLQSHIGGRLSQEAMGPRFQAYYQELELRSRFLEQSTGIGQGRAWARLEDFFRNGGPQGGAFAEALAGAEAGGRTPGRAAREDGHVEIRSGISKMTVNSDDAPPIARASGVARPPSLPRRRSPHTTLGEIADRLEPVLSPEALMQRLPDKIQRELCKLIGLKKIRTSQLTGIKFGNGLARSLGDRMRKIRDLPDHVPLAEASPEIQDAARVAALLVGIVEYLHRSNDIKVLSVFNDAFNQELLEYYEPFKTRLRDYLGPKFVQPKKGWAKGKEVVQPHEAVLAIAPGAMTSLVALARHNVLPGEPEEGKLSWLTRFFVIARNQDVADEINLQGTNRGNISLNGIQMNYAQDPKIEAVGPQGHGGLTQELLQRTIRLQLLNVPSDKLHEILTPEYIRNLPQDAVLCEAIGGGIPWEKMGRYKTNSEKRQTLLPHELINLALHAHGRKDVSVVSVGGYLQAKRLWRGDPTEPVEMVFAGPEVAANLVARTFAGARYHNAFLTASVTQDQHSTELGKAMKNVTTLAAGYYAVQLAVEQMERGALDFADLKERYKTEVRVPLFAVMYRLLVYNKGVDAEYHWKVEDDYWKCAGIDMFEVVNVIREAKKLDVSSRQTLKNFVLERVVNNPRIASTRNPKRGIVEALYRKIWRMQDASLKIQDLLSYENDGRTPKMTEEGVNSLPSMPLYFDLNHPIGRQDVSDIDNWFYGIRGVFDPHNPAIHPPKIPHRS